MSYSALAYLYDEINGEAYKPYAEMLCECFALADIPVREVLDLGCGTGGITALLAQKGYDMIGLDISPEMLNIARERNEGFNTLLLCQDMRKLDLYDVVDGAVCTLDSLNHLLRTADLSAVFARLRLFIAPQGLFIFDVNTPYKHRCILGDNTFVLEDDEVLCVWQNALDDKTCTVDMALDFFWEGEDGRYDRTSDTVRERAYTQKTWTRLLNDAGFEVLAVYADLTEESPQEDCARWVFVARNTRPAEEYA